MASNEYDPRRAYRYRSNNSYNDNRSNNSYNNYNSRRNFRRNSTNDNHNHPHPRHNNSKAPIPANSAANQGTYFAAAVPYSGQAPPPPPPQSDSSHCQYNSANVHSNYQEPSKYVELVNNNNATNVSGHNNPGNAWAGYPNIATGTAVPIESAVPVQYPMPKIEPDYGNTFQPIPSFPQFPSAVNQIPNAFPLQAPDQGQQSAAINMQPNSSVMTSTSAGMNPTYVNASVANLTGPAMTSYTVPATPHQSFFNPAMTSNQLNLNVASQLGMSFPGIATPQAPVNGNVAAAVQSSAATMPFAMTSYPYIDRTLAMQTAFGFQQSSGLGTLSGIPDLASAAFLNGGFNFYGMTGGAVNGYKNVNAGCSNGNANYQHYCNMLYDAIMNEFPKSAKQIVPTQTPFGLLPPPWMVYKMSLSNCSTPGMANCYPPLTPAGMELGQIRPMKNFI